MLKRLFLCAALSMGLAPSVQAEGDPITNFSESDKVMNAAIDRAIASLPLFFANAIDSDGYGVPGANLKVAFDVRNNGENQKEIIWVSPFRKFPDGTIAGLLANEPNFMPGLHQGDRVDFTMEMLRDWSLWREDGKSFGNFTTRVIANQMGASGADLRAKMREPAIPPNWTK